jgi:hypothetical protein
MDALFISAIPQDIDALMASFEPIAQKYREEEETSGKKALEESRKMKPQQRTVIAGSPESEYSPSLSAGGSPYDYFPYSGSSYVPSAYQSTPNNADQVSNQQDTQRKRDEPVQTKESTKDTPPKASEEPKDTSDDKRIRKGIDQFENNMNDAMQAIENINARPQAMTNIPAGELATAVRKIKQATGNVNTLKIKLKNASTPKKRDTFKQEIKDAYAIYKETFENVSKITGTTQTKNQNNNQERENETIYSLQDLIQASNELKSAINNI